MEVTRVRKEAFAVIGKEGSTLDGEGFIQRLWHDANEHFGEIASLAKRDGQGNLVGIWGAMSDFSRSFQPWKDFKQGLYLAGAECIDEAEAPEGWVKWTVPGYEYLCIEGQGGDAFQNALKYLRENVIPLVGAVHDFSCPKTGRNYMFFPIKWL